MQYLCKKNIEMDKIIGMGNALVDVLATLNDDHILTEMELPKGSMTLIDETKLLIINECFSEMETELATGGSAGNAIRGMACLGAGTGFIGKVGNDAYGKFYRLERDTQLLIPAYDYCMPDKACQGSTEDDPCSMFSRIHFPIDEFFPPDCVTPDEDYRSLL